MDLKNHHAHLDREIRHYVYQQLAQLTRVPATNDVAAHFNIPREDVLAAYQRLADGKALVLQSDGEILMAEPFSAVPTNFVVEAGGQSWWGNCIWDALGVLAALQTDGQVITTCGDCGEQMTVTVSAGELIAPEGIVHYAIPANRWWENVVFT